MKRLSISRVWLPGAMLYACSAFYLLFQGGKTSLMLFVMLNALILYLLLGRWSGIGGVQGSRSISLPNADSNLLAAGMRVQVKLKIQVPGVWPVPYVIVRDRLVRPAADESQIYELSFVPDYRRRGEVVYETAPLRRGHYRFETTNCSTRDIFGLFEHQGHFAEPMDIRVLPRMIALKDWQMLRRSQRGVFQHTFTSKWAKETTQIDGVREYIHGDRMSRIHWNATAKSGEWKSKEYEREALPRIVFVLDRHADSYSSPEQFELAVSAAASLLELVVQRGMPIGFVSCGDEPIWFGADRSPVIRDDVLRHLVDVEADGTVPLGHWVASAAERFESGVQVVVIGPLADDRLSQGFDILEARRMIPSLLHIADASEGEDRARKFRQWQQLCQVKQWDCQSISRLEDLPAAMGVASA